MLTSLKNPKAFFDNLRTNLFSPSLKPSEVDGLNAILTACGQGDWPVGWTAYALATAYRETAHTMTPISEYGGPSYLTRMYDPQGSRPALAKANGNTTPGDGVKYCGRGYVQLTWKNNYAKAGKKLGQDLVNSPTLALDPVIAAQIMIFGMSDGWFSGKSLKDYLPTSGPGTLAQFTSARKIINGVDHAEEIAHNALNFQDALNKGEWK